MSKTNGVHEYPKTKSELNFEMKLNGKNVKIRVSVKKKSVFILKPCKVFVKI